MCWGGGDGGGGAGGGGGGILPPPRACVFRSGGSGKLFDPPCDLQGGSKSFPRSRCCDDVFLVADMCGRGTCVAPDSMWATACVFTTMTSRSRLATRPCHYDSHGLPLCSMRHAHPSVFSARSSVPHAHPDVSFARSCMHHAHPSFSIARSSMRHAHLVPSIVRSSMRHDHPPASIARSSRRHAHPAASIARSSMRHAHPPLFMARSFTEFQGGVTRPDNLTLCFGTFVTMCDQFVTDL